jgi:alanyl-tRNA synthetase
MTPEQLKQVEEYVNEAIGKNAKMILEDMQKDKARAE